MATIAPSLPSDAQRERVFFLFMAMLLIAAALLGFGFFQYAGISSWGAPWWVHVHAVSSMGWLGFFALQNALVVRGEVTMHRKLGMFGVAYAIWLIAIDLALAVIGLLFRDGSERFPPSFSLALNTMMVLAFAVLFLAAFRMRHRSDWHKRLMLCATIALSGPAFGRILIMLGARTNLNLSILMLSVVAIGMVFDWRTRGAVHPAYYWGFGAVLAMGLLIGVLPQFPPFVALAERIAG